MLESRSFVGVSRVVDGAQLDAALAELAALRAENARLREEKRLAWQRLYDWRQGHRPECICLRCCVARDAYKIMTGKTVDPVLGLLLERPADPLDAALKEPGV